MGIINTSIVSPILGGSCCHQAFSILIDGMEWVKRVKKGLLKHSMNVLIIIVIIYPCSTIIEFIEHIYSHIYTYKHFL
jgi:predicted Na+-dependent transporter